MFETTYLVRKIYRMCDMLYIFYIAKQPFKLTGRNTPTQKSGCSKAASK